LPELPTLDGTCGIVGYYDESVEGPGRWSYSQNLWIDHPFEGAAYLPR
jgi:hypothetical protein